MWPARLLSHARPAERSADIGRHCYLSWHGTDRNTFTPIAFIMFLEVHAWADQERPSSDAAWERHSSTTRTLLGLPKKSSHWTSRSSVHLHGISPNSRRQMDLLNAAFEVRRNSLPPATPLETIIVTSHGQGRSEHWPHPRSGTILPTMFACRGWTTWWFRVGLGGFFMAQIRPISTLWLERPQACLSFVCSSCSCGRTLGALGMSGLWATQNDRRVVMLQIFWTLSINPLCMHGYAQEHTSIYTYAYLNCISEAA